MDENNVNNNEPQESWEQVPNNDNTEQTSNTNSYGYNEQPESTEGMTIATLVLGIVSVSMTVLCCGGGLISIVCGVLGLVFGVPQIRKNPNDDKAKAGVVLSAIGIGIATLFLVISIILSITGAVGDILYNRWI